MEVVLALEGMEVAHQRTFKVITMLRVHVCMAACKIYMRQN